MIKLRRSTTMTEKTTDRRLPYEPPRLRKIRIVPEELAAGGCKVTGPSTRTCRQGQKIVNRTHGS
jgi:hypothetical protein